MKDLALCSSRRDWFLRLDEESWHHQYTGKDPRLFLPDGFDELHARDFLRALARFADALMGMKQEMQDLRKSFRRAEICKTPVFSELYKKAYYHTSVLSPGMANGAAHMIHYLDPYVNPAPHNKRGFKWDNLETGMMTHCQFVARFLSICDHSSGKFSAQRFFKKLCARIKPQYIEPWLLYMGQTLEEVGIFIFLHPEEFSDDARRIILRVKEAYDEAGMPDVVNPLRDLAANLDGQESNRIIGHYLRAGRDKPTGEECGAVEDTPFALRHSETGYRDCHMTPSDRVRE